MHRFAKNPYSEKMAMKLVLFFALIVFGADYSGGEELMENLKQIEKNLVELKKKTNFTDPQDLA